jgi:hypothetical protein
MSQRVYKLSVYKMYLKWILRNKTKKLKENEVVYYSQGLRKNANSLLIKLPNLCCLVHN